jgi:hypothetical protein
LDQGCVGATVLDEEDSDGHEVIMGDVGRPGKIKNATSKNVTELRPSQSAAGTIAYGSIRMERRNSESNAVAPEAIAGSNRKHDFDLYLQSDLRQLRDNRTHLG